MSHFRFFVRTLAIVGSLSLLTVGAQATTHTHCEGTWELTCIAPAGCTYVSGYLAGRVENYDDVYWNLHTPTGPWTTVGSGCATTWSGIQPNGCPSTVTNCWGQTFSIQHNVTEPDLQITNISLSTSTVQSGNAVTVDYDLENNGTATVTPRYKERFYLKPTSGAAYEVFTTSETGTDIAANDSLPFAASPDLWGRAGSYTLQIEADAGKQVYEGNEFNNVTGVPITLTASPFGQFLIEGLVYRLGSGGGWGFALENCSPGSTCTRTFDVENIGSSNAFFGMTDATDMLTSVSSNCPAVLVPGGSCTITISSFLQSGDPHRYIGTLAVPGSVPEESPYEVCIASDTFLCRI